MMPWEREIYLSLLTRFINEENDRIRLKQMQQNNI